MRDISPVGSFFLLKTATCFHFFLEVLGLVITLRRVSLRLTTYKEMDLHIFWSSLNHWIPTTIYISLAIPNLQCGKPNIPYTPPKESLANWQNWELS